LQKQYGGPDQQIVNTLQTNGILLDDNWCEFLHGNNFLVGISIDGPEEFHNSYRTDHSGAGTFGKVVKVIENMKQHQVEFNALILLNSNNVDHPEEIFDFLAGMGLRYLQFVPCVEFNRQTGEVLPFSITPSQYGQFICRLFDRWIQHGVTKVSIRDFDSIMSWCLTGRHTMCTFDRSCASYIVIEHNGDAFCCDFFVEPQWRLGNILETSIGQLAGSDRKLAFIRVKQNLPNECLLCRHQAVCRSGCMKDKMSFFKGRANSRSYLCEGYKVFFDYTMPKFMQLAASFNAALADAGRKAHK
jgi:uncharacterized protein